MILVNLVILANLLILINFDDSGDAGESVFFW